MTCNRETPEYHANGRLQCQTVGMTIQTRDNPANMQDTCDMCMQVFQLQFSARIMQMRPLDNANTSEAPNMLHVRT